MRKVNRLAVLCVLVALLLMSLSLPLAGAQNEVTIRFWSHNYPPREAIDRDIIAQFEEAHPNIHVEYTIGPGDDFLYIPQLLTSLAGGEGPDLFNALTLLIPDMIPSGAVAPVNYEVMGFTSQDELVDLYIPGRLANFMDEDGVLYALPTEVGNYSLFINGLIFEEAGLDPAEDYPRTWEEMVEIAPLLTKRDESGNITQRAFDFAYPLPDEFIGHWLSFGAMAYQLGGTFFNEDLTEATANTEPWVRTLTYVRDWAEEFGGMAYTPSSIAFYEGNLGMVLSGAWYSDVIRENNPDLLPHIYTAPFPRWEDAVNDTGSYMYDYGLYVNSQSPPEVQEAAWMLAFELTSYPERYMTEALLMQPRMALIENEEVMGNTFATMFIQDMVGNPFFPLVEGGAEITPIFNRALERVLLEGMDPQESLDMANEELQALLDQAND